MSVGKRSSFRLGYAFGVVIAALVVGGYFGDKLADKKSPALAVPAPHTVIRPISDGNGLYYFPVRGDEYRHALAQFYTDNPDMDCAYHGAIEKWSADVVSIKGHILHCRGRNTATPAQDITVP